VLSIGIVGLPNVGKSTLFNALTDNNILAANYPFATIEPNTGIVPVPDERLTKLSKLYNDAPIKPATVTFVDIAGLVAGASQGEGLGNQFLANIRTCNAICHVVRAFEDPNVQHINNNRNPKEDIEIINTELVLADLQTVENKLPKLEKEAKTNSRLKNQLNFMQQIKQELSANIPLTHSKIYNNIRMNEDGVLLLKELQLLTAKPVIYLFNVDEETLTSKEKKAQLVSLVDDCQAVFVCAKLENELRSIDESDRSEFLQSYGVAESGLRQVVKVAYETLGLQSYLTAGVKEVRAWTIKKGMTAPEAAGVIHGDFERGFIVAQIIDYNDLINFGSLNSTKTAGKVRTEGKDYVMQPNDVVEFRFNV
jgi:GTP-binding protein YchF